MAEQGAGAARSRSAALCTCLLAALTVWRLAETPALIALSAILPALAYSVLLWRLDRTRNTPWLLRLFALLWGASAAALLATLANNATLDWLTALRDPAQARSLTAWLAAPAIEEIAKAAPLLLLLRVRPTVADTVRAGAVYGALIGIGFSLTENADYFLLAAVQGGEMGLWQNVYLRAILGGLNHATFTATVGAALGWGLPQRGGRRWVAPLLGLTLAIAEHALWNALTAQTIQALICNPALPDGPCRAPAPPFTLFVIAPLVVSACLGPPLLALGLFLRRCRAGPFARHSSGHPTSKSV